MRRSTTITLTLLAGAGLGLAYCARDPDTDGVLETQAACVDRLGDDAATECADVFESARLTHAASAPRFDTAEACHAATGTECSTLVAEPHSAGTPWASTAASVFIPAMAGVMIGRVLADGTRGATPVYAGAAPPPCPPTGVPAIPGCVPTSSSSTSGSGSLGSSSGSGRRYWYSGSNYAGSSDQTERGGFSRVTTSSQGEGLLSRSSRSGSSSSRAGTSSSRSGGLGFSAAAHSGGGS